MGTTDVSENGGYDVKFDCYTTGGSGTGTGTRYHTGHIGYDQCNFEKPKESLINLGNNSWAYPILLNKKLIIKKLIIQNIIHWYFNLFLFF